MEKNYFEELYNTDVSNKVKEKNGLRYISWAVAWAEVKKLHPDATYNIYEETLAYAPDGTTPMVTRPWFSDGKTAWVKTGVTINGIEHIENLPVMDFKNKSISVDNITSADANKSAQRSLTKACARHGLGLYIYEGEDLPEESKEIMKLQAEIMDQIKKKAALSEEAKAKVEKICKDADATANGDPRLIEDLETLKALKKSLMAVRK